MSRDIVQEVTFFLHSILMGIGITFAYDWLLILRKLVKHNILAISAEDFLFWIACGVGVFYMLYWENNGVLRWFAVAGAMIGMFFYKYLVRNRFVYIMSTCIHKIMWFVFRVIQFVLKPVKMLVFGIRKGVRFLEKKLKKVKDFVKKKLTVCIKTLKIILCKR